MRIKEIFEYNKNFLIKSFSEKFQEKKKNNHSSSIETLAELLNKTEQKKQFFNLINHYVK